MNLKEYEKVKNYSYLEYCDYLQEKYGVGLCDYMTKNWNKNPKITRTKEGLVAHHKFENSAKLLSKPSEAEKHPFEWQLKHNIIYCDFLEHLFLHMLICEETDKKLGLGKGGILEYMVPELNDVYSGFVSDKQWEINCHSAIINDKDVYFILLKRFKICFKEDEFIVDWLCKSANARKGRWSNIYNREIYEEIEIL